MSPTQGIYLAVFSASGKPADQVRNLSVSYQSNRQNGWNPSLKSRRAVTPKTNNCIDRKVCGWADRDLYFRASASCRAGDGGRESHDCWRETLQAASPLQRRCLLGLPSRDPVAQLSAVIEPRATPLRYASAILTFP